MQEAAQYSSAGSAIYFSISVGLKAIRSLWRRFGPDVIYIRFDRNDQRSGYVELSSAPGNVRRDRGAEIRDYSTERNC